MHASGAKAATAVQRRCVELLQSSDHDSDAKLLQIVEDLIEQRRGGVSQLQPPSANTSTGSHNTRTVKFVYSHR